jgi:hypothetical protein
MNSLVCAIRVSRQFMISLENYADQNETLFFCEALFPTIALKNNLKISCPQELSQIYFEHSYKLPNNININYLYHPLKDIKTHVLLHNKIKNNH